MSNNHFYSKLKRRFNSIISSSEVDSEMRNELIKIRDVVFDKFDSLKKEIEVSHHINKPSMPVDKRYINIIKVDSKNPKATYRPLTGELTIKIPDNYYKEYKMQKIQEFAEKVIKEFPDDIKVVLRGSVKWSETNQCFYATFKSPNNRCYDTKIGK